MYKAKDYTSTRDDIVGYVAGKIREQLEAFKASLSKEIKVGDVAVTTGFVQFHTDGDAPTGGDPNTIRLNMTFMGAGALMLVLEFGERYGAERAYTLDLHTGKTGWIDKEALAPHQ